MISLLFLSGKGSFTISIKELRVLMEGTREYLKGRETL